MHPLSSATSQNSALLPFNFNAAKDAKSKHKGVGDEGNEEESNNCVLPLFMFMSALYHLQIYNTAPAPLSADIKEPVPADKLCALVVAAECGSVPG